MQMETVQAAWPPLGPPWGGGSSVLTHVAKPEAKGRLEASVQHDLGGGASPQGGRWHFSGFLFCTCPTCHTCCQACVDVHEEGRGWWHVLPAAGCTCTLAPLQSSALCLCRTGHCQALCHLRNHPSRIARFFFCSGILTNRKHRDSERTRKESFWGRALWADRQEWCCQPGICLSHMPHPFLPRAWVKGKDEVGEALAVQVGRPW